MMTHLYLNLYFRADGTKLIGRLQCDLPEDLNINTERSIELGITNADLDILDTRLEDKRHSTASGNAHWFQTMGISLFNSLFVDEWRTYYDKAVAIARTENLVLQINICADKHPLADAIPWELMYDHVDKRYIGGEPKSVIIRSTYNHLHQPRPIVPAGEQVRVLFAASNPWPMDATRSDTEIPDLKKHLEDRLKNRVHVSTLPHATWDTLQDELQKQPAPHILHLIAHGDEQGIRFEDGRYAERYTYRTIYNTIADAEGLRLVIFSVCNASHILLRQRLDIPAQLPSISNVWAIVVPRTTISARAAYDFAVSLYRSLANGRSLTQAIGYMRSNAIGRMPIVGGQELPDLPEWSIPMVYEASDILVFPPLAQLRKVVTKEPLDIKQMKVLRRKTTELVRDLSQLQWDIDNESILSPATLRTMEDHNPLVGEIVFGLSNMDWEDDLLDWFDEVCDLSEKIDEELCRCSSFANTLKGLRPKAPEYESSRRKARQAVKHAFEYGQNLAGRIESLVKG
jgi:hypothetical protein